MTWGFSRDGSSPLARGTRVRHLAHDLDHRFIPARAGNTCRAAPSRRGPSVHPRSRGEHPLELGLTDREAGSSPLARGTPWDRGRPMRRWRFIPARAGNTWASFPSRSTTTVHPRSRGEHGSDGVVNATWAGSSPLARGTRGAGVGAAGGCRFIPARAGNTPSRARAGLTRPVHPRSRGEHECQGTLCR